MNDTKPNRFRRAMTHLKNNQEIYIPLALFAVSGTILTVIGVSLAKSVKEFDAEIAAALAEAGEGSRLLIDAHTGDYFISEPVTN